MLILDGAKMARLAEVQKPHWFWSHVDRGHPMDCWPWKGKKRWTNGYGSAERPDGSVAGAHRVAFEVSGGMLIPGMVIMHLCDNPPCCNPAHLRQGTYSDNIRDAIAKGRFTQHRFRLGRSVRASFCKRGHPLTPENRIGRLGACRQCDKLRGIAYRQRKKALA